MTTRINGIALQVEILDEQGDERHEVVTLVVEDDWTGDENDYLVIRHDGISYGIPLRDADEALALAGWVRKHEQGDRQEARDGD